MDWKPVTVVNGAGTTSLEQFYQFYDFTFSQNSINYYRLSQTDVNGSPRIVGNIVAIDNRMNGKTIVGRVNILGQQIPDTQKGLVILMFDDGTIEKRYIE